MPLPPLLGLGHQAWLLELDGLGSLCLEGEQLIYWDVSQAQKLTAGMTAHACDPSLGGR